METHKSKRDKGFTIIELIALIIVIALFWFGLKFGARFTVELFSDYKDESWFSIAGPVVAFIGAIFPVAMFIGSCICLGMYIEKRKKKNVDKQ